MKNTTDPRHTSRRIALASIFCWLFNEINTEESMVLSKEVLETESDEFDHDLVNFLVEGVKTHNQEIDKIIEECAPEWPIDKISKVDLVVLRLAIFEVLFGNQFPRRRSLDGVIFG